MKIYNTKNRGSVRYILLYVWLELKKIVPYSEDFVK